MGHFGKLFGRHHGCDEHHGRREGHSAPQPAQTLSASCPSCRRGNDPAARFCQHCGAGLVPRRCGSCGQEAVAAAKFCSHCGAGLGRNEIGR
ncbi:double zinc ribbon domain-containing protein [Chromobacterium vaccinii]|uniref:double zinc ribbon domain-containing protein n=1 Tax=Chromobacterium vaccinii TaxID=1108595 RepID=UPI0009E1BA0B